METLCSQGLALVFCLTAMVVEAGKRNFVPGGTILDIDHPPKKRDCYDREFQNDDGINNDRLEDGHSP